MSRWIKKRAYMVEVGEVVVIKAKFYVVDEIELHYKEGFDHSKYPDDHEPFETDELIDNTNIIWHIEKSDEINRGNEKEYQTQPRDLYVVAGHCKELELL